MPADEVVRLRAAAEALGVASGWRDVRGRWHEVAPDVLARVGLVAAGLGSVEEGGPLRWAEALEEAVAVTGAALVDPTLVCWVGEEPHVAMRLAPGTERVELSLRFDDRCDRPPASVGVDLAADALSTGQRAGCRHWRVPLGPLVGSDGVLPVGRHRLEVDAGARRGAATLLAAPRRVATPDPRDRPWGVVAPVWALWSRARPEPHLGHLGALAEQIDELGGQVVATLPMLATYLDRPFDPSPYTPVSRRFWNELYLDLAARPELRDCEPARRALAGGEPPPGPAPFDARDRYATVRAALGHLAEHLGRSDGPLGRDLAAFRSRGPVLDYARFRAAVERTGTGWHAWPGDGTATVDAVPDDDPAVAAHVYAQWAMARQLTRLSEVMARRGQRLQLDLPVGTHADGWDTFAHRQAFGWGASVGAPPDDFFTEGQDWGFPPLLAAAGRADGHALLAECLRAHMAVAGILRIDHAMQLQRLFWVPEGASAHQGTYVHQPLDELLATVAIESHLSGCAVVGEDLGTVTDEVRAAMAAHGVAGMWVAEFEQPADGPLRLPRPGQVASIDTHDTPTFAGWVRADDVGRSVDLGVLDAAAAEDLRRDRARAVGALLALLRDRGLLAHDVDPAASVEGSVATHAALLRLLGATEAAVLVVSLDDLVGQVEPINVPGTPTERPNWVLRLDRPVAELLADPTVRGALAGLQDARLAAWSETDGG